tara:strand:- start:1014 stop:1898 length:885 start_codon:yes stop_codon:yes gene_type:complete
MLLLLNIQDYLAKASRGELSVPPSHLKTFLEDCKVAVSRQLQRESREFRIRMSGLGRPLCQQLMEREGYTEEVDYNSVLRFLFGDITEAILMLVLRESGCKIVDFQKEVELPLGDSTIKGTLDVVLEDETGTKKVWDIKSASEWAFRYKYKAGYEKMKEDDLFGYLMQGHLYSEALGMPFGGWIVINKSSGEVAVVEVPDWQEEDRELYMKDARSRIKQLVNPNTKVTKFKSEPEMVKIAGFSEPTGNKILAKPCTFCGFRKHCWPKAKLHPKVTSRAKVKPEIWYETVKTPEL